MRQKHSRKYVIQITQTIFQSVLLQSCQQGGQFKALFYIFKGNKHFVFNIEDLVDQIYVIFSQNSILYCLNLCLVVDFTYCYNGKDKFIIVNSQSNNNRSTFHILVQNIVNLKCSLQSIYSPDYNKSIVQTIRIQSIYIADFFKLQHILQFLNQN